MPAISIVIPVYNVEAYISVCLDSIINQKQKELQVILVDDGSIDSSGQICDSYAQKDNRIEVYHTENRGLMAAWKYGFSKAKADYIGFVDADDWIDSDMYENLLNIALQTNADVVFADFVRDCDLGISCKMKELQIFTKKCVEEVLYPIFFSNGNYLSRGVPVNKKSVLEAIVNKCYDDVSIGEDLLATFNSVLVSEKIAIMKGYKPYHYRTNLGSMINRYSEKKYDAIISCAKLKKEIIENKDLQIFLEQSENYEELFPLLTDGVSEKHKKMIRTILDKLIEGQKKGKKFFGSLLDIYARIGYEVGRIKKRLQEAHINWGSYIDRGFDYHCNAHSNNLVILPQGNDSLLAPLDFDLAFSKEKMVTIYKEANTFGQHDETYWDNYINAEFVDLSLNLCGAEDYNFDFEKNKKNPDSFEVRIRNTIRYLLCDCMLENYMKGFDNIPSEDVIDNNKLKEDSFLHNIVKLALISTADDVA